MPEHVLTLVAARDSGEAPRRIVNAILAQWPTGEAPPRIAETPLDTLAEPGDGVEVPGDPAAMLVVLPADLAPAAPYAIVDRLQRWNIPAIVLAAGAHTELRHLQGGGVIVRPADADPRFLAHALFALAERQTLVRSLAGDLRMATRFSGGVRGEIDRLHEEMNLAAAVQLEMLPRAMPEAPGLEFGVIFRPVGYVSGDIYDVTQLDDRHIGILVADAVGHGVPAALMTMVINRSLRLIRTEDGAVVPPGEVLTRLNADLMKGRRQAPRFGSAIYGVIDTEAMTVSLAAAGHPRPLLVRSPTRAVSPVPTDGAILGVFPDEVYPDVTVALGPDDTLLIYSDGLETAFAAPLADHHQRRRSADHRHVEELRSVPWPDEAAGVRLHDSIIALGRLLDQQSGSLHQADDITALAIRRFAAAPAVRAA